MNLNHVVAPDGWSTFVVVTNRVVVVVFQVNVVHCHVVCGRCEPPTVN